MAKRYDPILCMMVDEPTKAQDAEKLHYYQHSYTKKWYVVSPDGKVFKEFNTEAEAKNYASGKAKDAKSLGKYKLPNGEIVEVIDRKNVHGVDTIVYKNSRGVHFATVDWFMSNAKKVYDSAKAKDRLVKVPDNKLKDFEANLRSAGFKVVSKSDRGMSTHYQVEVNSSKQFTESDLREWANKIDAVCDKMDSVAPTTWNIGLTADGKITAGLDVREMYVKDSASALDEAIKVCDASTGHKVVVFVENYLRSIGKNNSTGKYDKIVQGVKSLLSQSLLDDEGLKKAAEHEADRLLKKYNL